MSKIIIKGDYKGIHGYGAYIRSHLRALEAAGVPFYLMPITLDPQRLQSKEIEKWQRLEIDEVSPADCIVHYMEAPYMEKIPGVRNIAYTLFEADALPQLSTNESRDLAWVEILNSFDEVWTGSTFGKKVFEESGVRRPIRILQWSLVKSDKISSLEDVFVCKIKSWSPHQSLHRKLRPIFNFFGEMHPVIREPLISSGYLIFKIIGPIIGYIKAIIKLFKSTPPQFEEDEFRILVVNTWNERKNIEDSIKAVLFTFSKGDRVRLIIKTYDGISSWWMKALIIHRVQNLVNDLKIQHAPDIDLILEPLSEDQMNYLFSIGGVYLNTSKGEGLGGGVIQSMSRGVPVVTHLFSSIADFCTTDDSFIYDYSLEPVSWHFNFYGLRQRWARPNMESLSLSLRESWNLWRSNRLVFMDKGKLAQNNILSQCHPDKVVAMYLSLNFQSQSS